MTHHRAKALQLVTYLLAIPGKSGREKRVIDFIIRQLRQAGVPRSAMQTDNIHQKSLIGGEIGNLIVKLPGSQGRTRAPRRLLLAHVDTVPICVGCKPIRKGQWIKSADANT